MKKSNKAKKPAVKIADLKPTKDPKGGNPRKKRDSGE